LVFAQCILQENNNQGDLNIDQICLQSNEDLLSYYQKSTFPYSQNSISVYSKENVIEKDNIEDLICPICFYVLKNPISCSSNKNAHSFCKECIDKYLEEDEKCPVCKNYFEYINNYEIENSLNKLFS